MSTPDEMCKMAHSKMSGFFLGLGADFDAAQEMYTKAAAQYKLQGDYTRAGQTYIKAGECAAKLKNAFQVAEAYQEAATMYLKACSPEYEKTMNLAVQALIDNNRLSRAADMLVKAAEEHRSRGELDQAVAFYERAEKFYRSDSQEAKSQKCKMAQADIFSEQQQYGKALPLYQAIAKQMLGGPLKFQALTYQFKALLCELAQINAQDRQYQIAECAEHLDMYINENVYLAGTREEEVLRMLMSAVGDADGDKFEEAVLLLQSLKMLDEWCTAVLLVIKELTKESIL